MVLLSGRLTLIPVGSGITLIQGEFIFRKLCDAPVSNVALLLLLLSNYIVSFSVSYVFRQ